jgi:hypothetical protein
MPYPNEHSARIKDPSQFKVFRRGKFAPGIYAIFGKKDSKSPMEVQAIRFDKHKFTPEQAKEWLRKHGYKWIDFEPAKAE